MKLLTFDVGAGPRAGLLNGDVVVDATALLDAPTALRDVQALLEHSDTAIEDLEQALDSRTAPAVSLGQVDLRPPILRPPTVRDHIAFEEHATGQWTRQGNDSRMEVWAPLPIFYFSNPLCSVRTRRSGGLPRGGPAARLRM